MKTEIEEPRLVEGREYELVITLPMNYTCLSGIRDKTKATYLGYKEPKKEEHSNGGHLFFRVNEDKNNELEIYVASNSEKLFACDEISAYKCETIRLSLTEEEKRYLTEINNRRLAA